jgi:hypothetical protein
MKPGDIAPSLLAISKQKNFSVHKALNDEYWIKNLALGGGISVIQISEFFALLSKIQTIHLLEHSGDTIVWKHTSGGRYYVASADLIQF